MATVNPWASEPRTKAHKRVLAWAKGVNPPARDNLSGRVASAAAWGKALASEIGGTEPEEVARYIDDTKRYIARIQAMSAQLEAGEELEDPDPTSTLLESEDLSGKKDVVTRLMELSAMRWRIESLTGGLVGEVAERKRAAAAEKEESAAKRARGGAK